MGDIVIILDLANELWKQRQGALSCFKVLTNEWIIETVGVDSNLGCWVGKGRQGLYKATRGHA